MRFRTAGTVSEADQRSGLLWLNFELLGYRQTLDKAGAVCDMGPSAIRYAGLERKLEALGHHVKDLGNVTVPTPEMHTVTNEKLKYLNEVRQVAADVFEQVKGVLEQGHTPIILGGDHSISIGSVAGVAAANKPFGVIWYDAHGDMNTEETTPSGNIHGMPLAVSLGHGHPDLVNLGGFAPKGKPEERRSGGYSID